MRPGFRPRRVCPPRYNSEAAMLCLLLLLLAADYQAGMRAYQRGDYARALAQFRPLAERGKPQAQTVLATMYERGLGVDRNIRAAIRWYSRAAAQNDTEAMYGLGRIYAQGRVVPRDMPLALKWYERAALGGHALSMFTLANLYERGEGVLKDLIQAYLWYSLAAEYKYAGAAPALAGLREMMTPAQLRNAAALLPDYAKKIKPR
jgi:TPR repeat protein